MVSTRSSLKLLAKPLKGERKQRQRGKNLAAMFAKARETSQVDHIDLTAAHINPSGQMLDTSVPLARPSLTRRSVGDPKSTAANPVVCQDLEEHGAKYAMPAASISVGPTADFWDEDHRESDNVVVLNTRQVLSEKMAVKLGRSVKFESYPAVPVEDTAYAISTNHTSLQLSFKNMLELYVAVKKNDFQVLLKAIRLNSGASYSQFSLGCEIILIFHPLSKIFSIGKSELQIDGRLKVVNPVIFLQPSELKALSDLLTGHVAHITPALKMMTPCSASHATYLDQICCDFCSHI
jgi:hypothetical protein